MPATNARRTTSLTTAVAAMAMLIGMVTLPVATATDTHVKVAHTNSK